jgi:uncharacterized membrane protein required for colicin V production
MDGIVLVFLVAFTIRGILRGTVAQGFAFFGLLAGIWACAGLSHWIALHWHDAKPAVVFAILRWTAAGLGGLAITTLFGWWGETVAKAVHEGPLGWLDRLIGGVVGLAFGAAIGAILVLIALQAPGLGFARVAARHAVSARPLVRAGIAVTGWHGVPVPGAGWLHAQFVSANRHFSR